VTDRDRTDFLWRWKRRLFDGARIQLVCPSEWLAGIVRRSPLAGHMPVEVIPNPVDTRTFRPGRDDALRASLGISPESVVLAFASHASVPRKGFSHLVAATADARTRGDVVVLSMGEPLASAREERGIVWAGTVGPGEPMARLLRASDLLVLPTLAENLALVLLEAAATGLPVVAFDVGGTREAVKDGVTGLLVPAKDDAALSRAIGALTGDAARRASMGRAARAMAENAFDADVIATRYEAVYRSLKL
jgi:glycosyltransferase involved in cell wall biosynthesis